jgi:protein-tyrosine phosphatase
LIDIHSHILPGLDDGAESLEDAVAMVRIAAAAGTTDIVATPHANSKYPFDPQTVKARVAELREACGGIIRIHRGCDFHLSFQNVEDALENPAKYTINSGSYLLVEFADLQIPPNAAAVLNQLTVAGMTPIITHPERNPILQTRLDELESWAGQDCLMQVTAMSFLGRFGDAARKSAEKMMQRGLVHIVASDAHDVRYRTPALDEAYAHIARQFGADQAESVFRTNPAAVIADEPIDGPMPSAASRSRKKKWYRFF